ncbi:hypothetical protein MNBD_GAMMA12-712 [hydrothermal vent metagenome]|uniref:Uncharacterized protein n=1 Tax=hydrothermal vent metagenome TaxID=652676 RepID=A0A3B0YY82_9ZZZZ
MIFIVTALDCEARPLIQHYKLRRCQQFKPFPLYTGDDIRLVVSGIGAVNAMLATAMMAGINAGQSVVPHYVKPDLHLSPNSSVIAKPRHSIIPHSIIPGTQSPELAWLNIGIGGHYQYDIGSAFLAHKVSNAAVIKSPVMKSTVTDSTVIGESATIDPHTIAKVNTYYPIWGGKWPCSTENILTVPSVVSDYPTQGICEMEGTGFCEAAYRFSTAELVHLLKVVSDNKMQSIDSLNKTSIAALIEKQMPLISMVVESLQQTANALNDLAAMPNDYEFLVGHYPVSVSMQFQLKQLLRRWQLLAEHSILEIVPPEKYQSIKRWMKVATEQVALLRVSF